MNPVSNPFAPGAGTRPPELAGRDQIIEAATVALARTLRGRPAKSQMLLGLRGVGKTVLLNRINEIAEEQSYFTVFLEAPENRTLTEMLVPELRKLLFKLSGVAQAKDAARRGMQVLRRFASAFKVTVNDVEFGVDAGDGQGVADSGVLEADLPDLLITVAQAAAAAKTGVAVLIDEVQYLTDKELSALIVSVHLMGQRQLPVILFGAGLPQLAALAGEAKSYAERLFDYPDVGPLDPDAARRAIREPVRDEQAEIEDAALEHIVTQTRGYPYFLQEWGSHAWNAAPGSPITVADVIRANQQALDHLDRGFFRVRLDRLTPRERDYMRAMAELGPGPHRSSDVATALRVEVTTVGPLRGGLIKKGMLYSPAHGDTAFTVPMFDEFMRRSIPTWSPQVPAAALRRKNR